MIKVVVESKSRGDKEEYRHHKRIVIVIMYVAAAFHLVVTLASCLSRQFMLALVFLCYSYIFFSKGRELYRENLMIEFLVDMAEAMMENEKEGEE